MYERSCNFQKGVLSANIGRFVNLRTVTFLIIELRLLISSFIDLALDISQLVLLNPLNKINKHQIQRDMKSEKFYIIPVRFCVSNQSFVVYCLRNSCPCSVDFDCRESTYSEFG